MIAIPEIIESRSNNSEAKYTLMYCYWVSFQLDSIFPLYIGAFQLCDTSFDKPLSFFHFNMQRRLIWHRRPPIKCLLGKSWRASCSSLIMLSAVWESSQWLLTGLCRWPWKLLYLQPERQTWSLLGKVCAQQIHHLLRVISDVMCICVVLKSNYWQSFWRECGSDF